MKNCAICEHWLEHEQHGVGKCRRNVPMATLIPSQGIGGTGLAVITYWPETKAGDVCGECSPSQLLMAAARQGVDLPEGLPIGNIKL